MGDHRATIKIEFSLPNKTYKAEINHVNYCADSDGIDERVREFFDESWSDYIAWYNNKVDEHFRKENAAQIEQDERATLARLKEKYDAPPPLKEQG